MRIVFFSDNFYPEISGISDSILITGKELTRRGHQVLYTAARYAPKDYALVSKRESHCPPESLSLECVDGMSIIRLPSVPLLFSPTKQSRIVLSFGHSFSYLKKFKPDIIHTNSPYGCGSEARRAAGEFGIPLIGTNHTPIAEFYPWTPRLARTLDARYYNHCVFVSTPYAALLEDMREVGFKRDGKAISNPVELPLFGPTTEKKERKQQLGLDGPVLFYAGRLAKEKRVDVILNAMAILMPRFPKLTFIATGHGAEEHNLRVLVKKLNLEPHVRFTGFIPMEKLASLYQAADLFVIMSTADSQSVSLMQAYATALPAIGARAHGLPDYIPPQCGFLVEPGNVLELAQRIEELLNNSSLRERMGEAGRAFVKQFSSQSIATQWEGVYQKYANKL